MRKYKKIEKAEVKNKNSKRNEKGYPFSYKKIGIKRSINPIAKEDKLSNLS